MIEIINESSTYKKTYKCPYCNLRDTRDKLVYHIDRKHEDMIPQEYTALRLVFNLVNKKDHGTCIICKNESPWNEDKGRYERICTNPKCKESYTKIVDARMINIHGKRKLLDDPMQQQKMLANRRISGKYKFSDGAIKTYTGSYEKAALEFMDLALNCNSYDIQCPGPTLDYTYKGEKHFYISDIYYIPYNLLIEIKDGGDNPNTRNMEEYRGKQLAKEGQIIKDKDYNYLRLTNNNFEQLLQIFAELKMALQDGIDEKIVRIHENMAGVIGAALPPQHSYRNIYVVPYMMNNVFTGTALSKGCTPDEMIAVDDESNTLVRKNASFMKDKKYKMIKISESIAPFIIEELYKAFNNNEKVPNDYISNLVYSYSNNGELLTEELTIRDRMNFIKESTKANILDTNICFESALNLLNEDTSYIIQEDENGIFIRDNKSGNRTMSMKSLPELKKYISNESSSIIEESYNIKHPVKLYRVTYNGNDVMWAIYNKLPDNESNCLGGWSFMDEKEPDNKKKLNKQYFTDLGYSKFKRSILPKAKKYIDESKIKASEPIIIDKNDDRIVSYSSDQMTLSHKIKKVIKESVDNTFESIISFNSKCNIMGYILPNNGNIIMDFTGEDFVNKYKLLTPQEFEKYNGGVCWDYVVYEANYFSKNFKDIRYNTYYIELIDTENTRPTHTVLIFNYNNKYYWFESSWKPMVGIREFKTESNALSYIVEELVKDAQGKIIDRNVHKYNALDKSLYGLKCNQYMNKMRRCKRISINGAISEPLSYINKTDLSMHNESYTNTQLYRVEYENDGIYNAVKTNCTKKEWIDLLKSDTFTWLPKPPNYADKYKSYFTESGYKMFMKKTLPEIIKYINKNKINIINDTISNPNIVYEDKYQIVLSNDLLKESTNDTSNHLFFLSSINMDNKSLQPRIPDNFLTKNDYEDSSTLRVCFSKSIDGALMGLSQNLAGKEFYVHCPKNEVEYYTPTTKEVPDCKITSEVWVKRAVNLRCIGKIKVLKNSGNPGYKYNYGDKTAELYDWDWKWVSDYKIESSDIINESSILAESKKLNKVPIYIVNYNYSSLFGSMVRLRTKSQFNHTSISLDSSLEKMYTFARNSKHGEVEGNNGFSIEPLSEMINRDPNCTIKVDVIMISKSSYDKLKKGIDYYIEHSADTNFNYFNILRIAFGIRIEDKDLDQNSLNCSVFVDKILKSSGVDINEKDTSNLVVPSDFATAERRNDNMYTIYYGKAIDYKVDKIQRHHFFESTIMQEQYSNFVDPFYDQLIDFYGYCPEYITRLNEASNPTKGNIIELVGGYLKSRIYINNDTKSFVIKGINFDKFNKRLLEMYQYRGIKNLFDTHYSAYSMYLWKKEKINKKNMKILNLEAPLFFALELYKIFFDLGDFYDLPYYKKLSKEIYNKTWISNFEDRNIKETDTTNLNRFCYELKDYQLEYLKKYTVNKYLYDLEGDILSFEQGLGKTFTAIAIAECLNKDQIIIVCPNSLKENWAYEIKAYYKIYTNNEDKWKRDIYIYNNSKFTAKNSKFIITNQESIDKIFRVVNKNKDTMIIVDESHNFRNNDSIRTNNLLKLKEITNCKDNLLMSGTPIKALPNEIVPSLKMIDPYFTEEVSEIYQKSFTISKPAISEVLKERFSRVIYRKTKSEVLSLPNKNIEEFKIPIKNSEQYELKEIRKRITREFNQIYADKIKDLDINKRKFESLVLKYSSASKSDTNKYLRYIYTNSNPEIDAEDIHEYRKFTYRNFLNENVYPNIKDESTRKKLKQLASQYIYVLQSANGIAIGRILPLAKNNCYNDILDENIKYFITKINENNKKTIIFTQFLEVANHAEEVLTKNGIGCVKIVGGTKNRIDLINKFKETDEIDVLIATTQTLSTGVTLTEASQMFFLGTPYRSADFDQACDRIHRIGQTSDVNIYIVLLDSEYKNITDRIDEIMDWSDDSFSNLIYNESAGMDYNINVAQDILRNCGGNVYIRNTSRNNPHYHSSLIGTVDSYHSDNIIENINKRIDHKYEIHGRNTDSGDVYLYMSLK